ncbi:carboxypeptidase-like regulatory domain-containing protein [Hymenobacter daeguensis]
MTFRHPTCLVVAWLLLLASNRGQAQHQQWYTSEVAVETGHAPCDNCMLGMGNDTLVETGSGQITAVTMFVFDTIATYAQGRIVDIATGKPIAGAVIQAQHACHNGCDVKMAATNQAGFFRLGWVGCHGPKDWRSNRPLLILAPGYKSIRTEAVKFGGGAYLHVELAKVDKK